MSAEQTRHVADARGITVTIPGYVRIRLLRGEVVWTKGYPYADVNGVYSEWESIDDYATEWEEGPVGIRIGTAWDLPADWPTFMEPPGLWRGLWGLLTTGSWPAPVSKPVGGRYAEKTFKRRVPAAWVSAVLPGDGWLV